MAINKGIEMKLNVKPVFIDFSHDYAYEGPCRFGKGDTLEPAFDRMVNEEIYNGFLQMVAAKMPSYVNFMEPARMKSYTDEWNVIDEDLQEILKPDETDVYILSSSGRACQVFIEFARKCGKPILYQSSVVFAYATDITSLRVRGLEVYGMYDDENTQRVLKALLVRKVLKNSRALVVNRFSADFSPVSAQDGFLSLEKVKEKLGINFNMMDVHEFLDQLTVRPCEENPTTPGRRGQNINEQDMKEIERITDELMAGAAECDMTRDNIIKSVKAYYLINKLLAFKSCNAFCAPCPDMCSTRRLNQEQCTLCLAHSLNEEHGIPSACEADLDIMICKIILETLTGKATYMGNSAWLEMKDGKPVTADLGNALPEEYEPLNAYDNLAFTLHSVANRKLKGYDQPQEEYAIRSFAYSGWGATMRYDFSKDMGQDVTVIRISPDCEKMLVVHGKIKGQFGYKRQNCSTACVYEVEDSRAFFEKTFDFGSHMALVYGDYRKELQAVCDVLGLTMVTA